MLQYQAVFIVIFILNDDGFTIEYYCHQVAKILVRETLVVHSSRPKLGVFSPI